MKELPSLEEAQNPLVNARRATISGQPMSTSGLARAKRLCAFCKKPFAVAGIKQKFCSNRCRLLFWAAGEIVREFQAGNADGLKETVKKIAKL